MVLTPCQHTEFISTNLQDRAEANFGRLQGKMAQEYVDLSEHPKAQIDQRQVPSGLTVAITKTKIRRKAL
ncbi:hypothetical protein IP81_01755 [Novosphingobium sp. AAP83]|nr:hypothetical protein IP81_01755 [Novosphingobium sp. AAP83]